MKTERSIKKRVPQDARVFYRVKSPPPINREITHADYTLPEIAAMCADGWRITFCQLQRSVMVDAVEVTLTDGDIPLLEAPGEESAAEAQ